MVSPGTNGKSWEEEIYWNNFHSIHFSLLLPDDFYDHLALPRKFAHYMRTNLPDKVVLKVNGITWDVNLEKGEDDVMLKGEEWQQFTKAYSLKKADMLVCKYNRHECFEVLLFDQANLCEKEASYFVRKNQQPKCDNNHDSNGEAAMEISSEFTERSQRNYDHNFAPENKRRKRACRTPEGYFSAKATHTGDDLDDEESEETSEESKSISRHTSAAKIIAARRRNPRGVFKYLKRMRNKSISEQHRTPKKASCSRVRGVTLKSLRERNTSVAEKTVGKSYSVCYISNRRPVTDAEKEKAVEMAIKKMAEYENSFIVVMRPTCVYKRFYMTIPERHRVYEKGQKLILRVKEKTWVCTIVTGGLEGGFKSFARENFLEEFDVCLFAPSVPMNGTPVLDVSILRVVPEVVPPSVLKTP